MKTACIYVSDTPTGTVTKFHADGCKLTFATGLNEPAGIGFSKRGDVLVACAGDGTIQKFDAAGTQSVFATGLDRPMGLAVNRPGQVFVACAGSNTIERFSPSGSQTTFASGLTMANPYLAFNSLGKLFAANTRTVEKFASNGTHATVLTVLNFVYGIAFDQKGKMYVSLQNSGSIQGLPKGGNDGLYPPTSFFPAGLAYDHLEGHLYVALRSSIRRYHLDGCTAEFATGFEAAEYLATRVEG